MKKNVLLLTSHFNSKYSVHDTIICNDFVTEFVKMGFNVRVVHNKIIYPRLFYFLAENIMPVVSFFLGSDRVDSQIERSSLEFTTHNIDVLYNPIMKYIPRGKFLERNIDKGVKNILNYLEKCNYEPDYILGHFFNPNIFILSELIKVYPNSVSSIVIHEKSYNIRKVINDEDLCGVLKKIRNVGFRSDSLRKAFDHLNLGNTNIFVNRSGIPVEYCINSLDREGISTDISIGFVGQLINRKHPVALIEVAALSPFIKEVVIVGDGPLRERIRKQAQKLMVNLDLVYQMRRLEVLAVLDRLDVFVMISENEAFGLVYIEAMARGKIVVGSKNEGIDGVIVDGENGFLCEAGDHLELAKILLKISKMGAMESELMRYKALSTAKKFSKEKVAYEYLKQLK